MRAAPAHTLLALLAACSFSPAPLPVSGDGPLSPDAPSAVDADVADVAELDAPVDARVLDAAPPDALDLCPAPSLALAPPTTAAGTESGASRFTPACGAGTSGGEIFYHLDVPPGPDSDLVVDVVDGPGQNSVADLGTTCTSGGGFDTCADLGGTGAGEVAVVTHVVPGQRYYLVVDSVAGSEAGFTLNATLRQIVGLNAACSPYLIESRCQSGVCLDVDAVARCADVPTRVVTNDKNPCAASNKISADAAYLFEMSDPSDVNITELDPSANANLRVVVSDAFGGCAVDTALDLLGGDCAHPTLVQSDDNSGLGPCPLLDLVPLVGGQRYWLRIRAAQGALVKPGARSVVAVDFVDAK